MSRRPLRPASVFSMMMMMMMTHCASVCSFQTSLQSADMYGRRQFSDKLLISRKQNCWFHAALECDSLNKLPLAARNNKRCCLINSKPLNSPRNVHECFIFTRLRRSVDGDADGWEGNRRSAVSLIVYQPTLVLIHLWAQGPIKRQEHPVCTLYG